MKHPFLLSAFAAALAAPFSAAPAQPASAAQQDWSRTVVMTPDGGFRMGNPDARVKLIEYGSLTCPHCAHFAETGFKPLISNYVRTGKVSFEYRNLILNGIDVTASLLARCAGTQGFFPLTESMFVAQQQWIGKISGLSEAEKERISALPRGEQFAAIAEASGLTALAARAGVTPQKGKQCLADEAGLNRLDEMRRAAAALGIEGTPTFLLNGSKAGASDWPGLEPLIRSAGG